MALSPKSTTMHHEFSICPQRSWLLPHVDANACKIRRTVNGISEPMAVIEQHRIISLARAVAHTSLRSTAFSHLRWLIWEPAIGVRAALIGSVETTNL